MTRKQIDEPCRGPRLQTSSGVQDTWLREPCGQTTKPARSLAAEPQGGNGPPQVWRGRRMTARFVEEASVRNQSAKASSENHDFTKCCSMISIDVMSYLGPIETSLAPNCLLMMRWLFASAFAQLEVEVGMTKAANQLLPGAPIFQAVNKKAVIREESMPSANNSPSFFRSGSTACSRQGAMREGSTQQEPPVKHSHAKPGRASTRQTHQGMSSASPISSHSKSFAGKSAFAHIFRRNPRHRPLIMFKFCMNIR